MGHIFNGDLTSAFAPSKPFLIQNDRIVVDFFLTVTQAATEVEWYFEFTSNPADPNGTRWYRETSYIDTAGSVAMPPVVRTFGVLGADTYGRDVQEVKIHRYCRVQIRVAAGASSADIDVPLGLDVMAPA